MEEECSYVYNLLDVPVTIISFVHVGTTAIPIKPTRGRTPGNTIPAKNMIKIKEVYFNIVNDDGSMIKLIIKRKNEYHCLIYAAGIDDYDDYIPEPPKMPDDWWAIFNTNM